MSSDHIHNYFKEKNLIITVVLNFIITLVEVIGGLLSGSLSLLSDALHNFSDGISVIVSFIALKLSKRGNTLKNTFGYKRAEILAALFNSSFLIIISFFLFKEAYLRIQHPQNIDSKIMIAVALITIVDPILTFAIGAYVLKEGFDIIKQSINILMEKTPVQINILKIKEVIEKIPEVDNLHHVHIWQINDKEFLFEGHIDIKKDEKIRSDINSTLSNKFGINHTTLQLEYNACKDKKIIKNHWQT